MAAGVVDYLEYLHPKIPVSKEAIAVSRHFENLMTGPYRYQGVRTDVFPNNATKPTLPAHRCDAPFWATNCIKLDGYPAKHESDAAEKVMKSQEFFPFSGLVPKPVIRYSY